jgi:regulatory protein
MDGARKYSLLEAKAKLEALCAYQERCSFELEQKMIEWGVDREDRDRLLAFLIEHNFLNEERFAEAYTSGKVNIKRWGKIKIKTELKRRKISEYSIKKALNAIDTDTYLSNLRKLAAQKIKANSKEKNAFARKAKVYRFLASKGYEQDLIREEVEALLSAISDD